MHTVPHLAVHAPLLHEPGVEGLGLRLEEALGHPRPAAPHLLPVSEQEADLVQERVGASTTLREFGELLASRFDWMMIDSLM
jgi:hypothetical protein